MSRPTFLSILLIFALLTVKCAKNDENQKTDIIANKRINLSGKPLDEVLRIKYAKATLKCDVWLQYGEKLDLTLPPNNSVTVDIKKDFILPQTVLLNAKTIDQSFSAEIIIDSIKLIGNLKHVPSDSKSSYEIQNTPHLIGTYRGKSAVRFNDGPVTTTFQSNSLNLYEKIKTEITNGEVSPNTEQMKNKYFDHASCYIVTEINPPYNDEFTILENN